MCHWKHMRKLELSFLYSLADSVPFADSRLLVRRCRRHLSALSHHGRERARPSPQTSTGRSPFDGGGRREPARVLARSRYLTLELSIAYYTPNRKRAAFHRNSPCKPLQKQGRARGIGRGGPTRLILTTTLFVRSE